MWYSPVSPLYNCLLARSGQCFVILLAIRQKFVLHAKTRAACWWWLKIILPQPTHHNLSIFSHALSSDLYLVWKTDIFIYIIEIWIIIQNWPALNLYAYTAANRNTLLETETVSKHEVQTSSGKSVGFLSPPLTVCLSQYHHYHHLHNLSNAHLVLWSKQKRALRVNMALIVFQNLCVAVV